MATLVLSAVGSIGGPFGTAIGSIIGKEIDNALFGTSNQGPRLKELAATTSSYGQPIQRNFGRMRVAGSVIWATDFVETSSREGGKGQPSTTVYTYSASFAVALSSTPIARLGRIWADGNLLRGANEDLKVEGELRTYLGTGYDPVDPLIFADHADQAPAFRDCAYVVFENLQLADYGNRIPALTFEIFATEDQTVSLAQIAPQTLSTEQSSLIEFARGFADDGGPVASSLAAINQVTPLYCVTSGDGFSLSTSPTQTGRIPTLPEQLASIADRESEDRTKQRAEGLDLTPLAVRYYDEQRDYQPGVQRAVGIRPNGRENMIDLPATMDAEGARQLANSNAQRARWHHEKVTWRVATLDPSIQPGSLVKLPDAPGRWIVTSWEWFDRGIELNLVRAAPTIGAPVTSEAGQLLRPVDLPLSPTALQFFELPSDGIADASQPLLYAAASSDSPGWRGAALYAEQGSTLLPIGSAGSRRAVIGQTISSLAASQSTLFEPLASIDLQLVGTDLTLEPTDLAGLSNGHNRLLIGNEILQFADVHDLGEGQWRLNGLVRGRAGTEEFAMAGHATGTSVALLDDRLTPLDAARVSNSPSSRIAAIGRGDQAPIFAEFKNAGASRRPLSPVHPRRRSDADGNWLLCWTRRARGQWLWESSIELPLVEERERYLVGFGSVAAPFSTWETNAPQIMFSANERAALIGEFGGGTLWVRQIGTFDLSSALNLVNLS